MSDPKFKYPSKRRILAAVRNDQWLFSFPNGLGASVVRGPYSYGGPEGLFELGVIGVDGHLTYKTSITDDVVGNLTVEQVNQLLDRIAAL